MNEAKKQLGIPILKPDKIELKPKVVRRDKGEYILIKETSTKRTLKFYMFMCQTQGHPVS